MFNIIETPRNYFTRELLPAQYRPCAVHPLPQCTLWPKMAQFFVRLNFIKDPTTPQVCRYTTL